MEKQGKSEIFESIGEVRISVAESPPDIGNGCVSVLVSRLPMDPSQFDTVHLPLPEKVYTEFVKWMKND